MGFIGFDMFFCKAWEPLDKDKKAFPRTEHLTTIPVIVPRGGEAWVAG